MNPDAVYWQQPAAVDVWLHDGTHREELFASRMLAEEYVASISVMQLMGDERGLDIHRAKIRPLMLGVN